jgi:hypothetical protein
VRSATRRLSTDLGPTLTLCRSSARPASRTTPRRLPRPFDSMRRGRRRQRRCDGGRSDDLAVGKDPNHADLPEGGNSEPVTYGRLAKAGRMPVDGGGAGFLFGMIVTPRRWRRDGRSCPRRRSSVCALCRLTAIRPAAAGRALPGAEVGAPCNDRGAAGADETWPPGPYRVALMYARDRDLGRLARPTGVPRKAEAYSPCRYGRISSEIMLDRERRQVGGDILPVA